MTVTKVGPHRWQSSEANHQEWDSQQEAERWDKYFQREREPEMPEELLSTEQLRQIVNAQSFAHVWHQVQIEFVENNPDYIVNEHNANKIIDQLQLRGLINNDRTVCTASIVDVQRAFNDLAAKGMLQLKEGGRKSFNARDAYAMPMDQLENRIRGLE